MRRFIFAWLYKYNGMLAGLLGLCLIVGMSLHVMSAQFDQAQRCQSEHGAVQLSDKATQVSDKKAGSCRVRHQVPGFSMLDFVFNRP